MRTPITRSHPYTPHRGSVAGQTFKSERQYRNALARVQARPLLSQQVRERRAELERAGMGKPASRAHPKTQDFLTERGRVRLSVTDQRTLSTIGAYHSARSWYLATGLDSRLKDFRGKSIVVGGKRYTFDTNLDRITRQERIGDNRLQYASGRRLVGRRDEEEPDVEAEGDEDNFDEDVVADD